MKQSAQQDLETELPYVVDDDIADDIEGADDLIEPIFIEDFDGGVCGAGDLIDNDLSVTTMALGEESCSPLL